MNDIFVQLAIVLGLASFFGFLIKLTKLPLIIAYLLVGVAISGISIFNFNNSAVATLPDIGIAFALFLTGMELDLREIRAFGKPIFVTGMLQIIISAIAGITLASLFGFRHAEAFYLGVGLSFSSTVVVVKMLLERDDLNSLYGKLAIGITLLEDLVAILLLMLLSVKSSIFNVHTSGINPMLTFVGKGTLLLVLAFLFAKFVLTKIFEAVSDSTELLYVTALTWCFVFISISVLLGFSLVIGAFLAGVALASSPFHFHISSRIKPLRDFFVVLFFVYLGSKVSFSLLLPNLPLILIFTAYALLLKPFIFSLLLGAFGFRKHTIFQSSITLGQISEFSLIVLLFGVKMDLINQSSLTVMAFTVVLTIILSSSIITHSRTIYSKVRSFMEFFERKDSFIYLEKRLESLPEDHVVLVGAGQIGEPMVDFFQKENIPFVVLDFNPQVVEKLVAKKANAFYGDISDPEVLDNLNLEKAKLIISTATDPDDTKTLLSELKRRRSSAVVVVRVTKDKEIKEMRNRGADYVVLPENVSADFLVSQLKSHWPDVRFSHLD